MALHTGIQSPSPRPAVPARGLAASLAILILLALLALSCGESKRIPAVGPFSDVYLFTELGEYNPMLRKFVSDLAHPVTYVFEEENEFNVFLHSAGALAGNTNRKNIIIMVRTDREGALRNRVLSQLGKDILARVRQEGHLVLYKQDLYARDQDIFFVLFHGTAEEEYVLTRLGLTVNRRLTETTRDRYRDYLLGKRENKGGAKYMKQEHGFSLRFPSEYHLLQERNDLGALELHRKDPSRVIGVFWRKGVAAPLTLADSLEILNWRATVVDTLYGGDFILEEETRFSASELGEYPALRMQGVWQNERSMTGGAFVTYVIHDQGRQRLLAVDLLLYAPGIDKHPYMRELEALASTFRY